MYDTKKAKNKHILQKLLNQAMIFYYGTEFAQDAYALKWLDKSYAQVVKK